VGVLPKELEERLAKASAYAELIGYVASITLKVTALQAINRRMSFFQEGLERSVCHLRSGTPQVSFAVAQLLCVLHLLVPITPCMPGTPGVAGRP
jgi:hypothetical protein